MGIQEEETGPIPDSGAIPGSGAVPGSSDGDDTVWFGEERVGRAEKADRVRAVFDSVADRYDLMNDLMSLGIHRIWKRGLISWLDPRPGQTLLDVAGGTGDIAARFVAAADRRAGALGARSAEAVICDINRQMLERGRARLLDGGQLAGEGRALTRVSWACGDAEALPFPDRRFDAYSIAFGLRNVTDIPAALAEAHRVLCYGGRFACLEFGPNVAPPLDALFDLYSDRVLPRLGQMVARDRDSYVYLSESIRHFPNRETLSRLMKSAGFARVDSLAMSGGVAVLHTGWRL